ncbi:L,D-transpeptidase family protein [Streptomyces antarcticus]|uniref:L,D-transpeptidase family protein n=1 Tax=Streptomyces antarcticus TaxID=2996458 RepID=UPI00226FA8A9|nr:MULTISPECIES: L,D-transpeptidase family protein [unclassified Streptomyces]MCY0944264.1 L,D-transpeptidase family protein [Streptomyces sp. H34-AA3]MCY0954709.1 L,D-transpeptidase family protein [Streptomyces sp. H27-S2]MCZ4087158.1 L,D-transpeptidase family protein [Streptomyces sp. H34-S5]
MHARRALPAAVLALAALTTLPGCDGTPAAAPAPGAGTGRAAVAQGGRAAEIPGLGPLTRGGVPGDARQAVVVTGRDPDSGTSTVTLYERDAAGGWTPAPLSGSGWPAHNGRRGWTDHHTQGDLRSPVGVYGLTGAGGLLDDPGTRLPYDQGSAFTIGGTGSLGEPLAGSFDYVVAIDYNREPGTSPLNRTRPLGEGRGGGIWLHVDHNGPTEGCVSLAKPQMGELLRWLDPERRPVIVMGDADSLRR